MFSGEPDSRAPRRVAALVLPLLAPEIARTALGSSGGSKGRAAPGSAPAPLAVLIDELAVARAARQLGLDFGDARDAASPRTSASRDEDGARSIDAVDEVAHALGVRPGQRVSEASALTHGLVVAHVASRSIEAALARVADVALDMGPTVSIGPPDTVWVDVTGAAHLWGGEAALLAELEARVAELGHRVRGAIADGPRIARALARFGGRLRADKIVAPGRSSEALAPLPVRALFGSQATAPGRVTPSKARAASNGDADLIALLARLGVWTIADLVRLPRAATASRLGPCGQEVLALAHGHDPMPLVAHSPPAMVIEGTSLDDGVDNAGALVFVARGLVSRAAARLEARNEAASRLEIELAYDASIFALREGVAPYQEEENRGGTPRGHGAQGASLLVAVDLPAPLSHETDLLRAVKAKIEALVLLAPVTAVRIVLSRIAQAPEVQLAMDRDPSLDAEALPALLSELAAEIGEDRLGVLSRVDDLRPEAQSILEPPRLGAIADDVESLLRVSLRRKRLEARQERDAREAYGERARDFDGSLLPSPTRLLRAPLPIALSPRLSLDRGAAPWTGKLEPGMSVLVGGRHFVVEVATFDRRVDGVRWWTRTPASRDYLRVWLRDARDAAIAAEAWVYIDRRERQAQIQGLWE